MSESQGNDKPQLENRRKESCQTGIIGCRREISPVSGSFISAERLHKSVNINVTFLWKTTSRWKCWPCRRGWDHKYLCGRSDGNIFFSTTSSDILLETVIRWGALRFIHLWAGCKAHWSQEFVSLWAPVQRLRFKEALQRPFAWVNAAAKVHFWFWTHAYVQPPLQAPPKTLCLPSWPCFDCHCSLNLCFSAYSVPRKILILPGQNKNIVATFSFPL